MSIGVFRRLSQLEMVGFRFGQFVFLTGAMRDIGNEEKLPGALWPHDDRIANKGFFTTSLLFCSRDDPFQIRGCV